MSKLKQLKAYRKDEPKRPWRCDVVDGAGEMIAVAFGMTQTEAAETARAIMDGLKALRAIRAAAPSAERQP